MAKAGTYQAIAAWQHMFLGLEDDVIVSGPKACQVRLLNACVKVSQRSGVTRPAPAFRRHFTHDPLPEGKKTEFLRHGNFSGSL